MVSIKQNCFCGLILFTSIMLYSCQEKVFTADVNCDECYTDKPDSVDLVIDLTFNEQNPEVEVFFYKGNIDKGTFLDSAFFDKEHPGYFWVKSNEYYSAKAIYLSSNEKDTIIVVDGTKQKIKKVTGQCDNDCWVIEGEKLNLKLAF
jgi:hypothetical protein